MQDEPGWLPRCEVYGEAIRDWVSLSKYRFDVVTHVPHDAGWMKRLRDLGSRPVPYVTLYQQPVSSSYQGIELRRHTDWIELDQDGNWKRTSFWDTEDQKDWYVVCPNVRGYVDAILAHVRSLMEDGAGGIFVDNVGGRPRCYGPDYGVHHHLHPDQVTAFAALLGSVRDVIRQYDPEGVLLLNSASPETLPDEYWAQADSDMAESYICTWVSDKRWMDWHEHWNAMGKKVSPWLVRGRTVLALSYLGHTHNSIKDDAYFCYCSARLSGFLWSAGGNVLRGDPSEVLYSIRLGSPVADEHESGGIHHRQFERGVVAVNPEDRDGSLVIPGQDGCAVLDLYEQRIVGASGEDCATVVPAQSGRVYLHVPVPAALNPEPHLLQVSTSPALGNVKFIIDGVEHYARSGRWKIEYDKGPDFGTLSTRYATAGDHVIEAADVEARGLEVSKHYGSVEKLGALMDPAEPTRPAGDRSYRFLSWRLGDQTILDRKITIRIEGEVFLVAVYSELDRPG